MTVLQRAATIAAMTFALAGLIGHSTPSLASDIDRTALPAPIVAQPVVGTADPMAASTVSTDPAAQPLATAIDAPAFDSLSDAVAAADGGDLTDPVRCLAGAVYFEAKGEPLAGQLAVANVIINRSRSGRFPADVCAVVKQRGQFGFVRGGEIPAISEGSRAYRTAAAVARVALGGRWDSPTPTALYFNTPNRAPGARLTRIAMIGNHVFYR